MMDRPSPYWKKAVVVSLIAAMTATGTAYAETAGDETEPTEAVTPSMRLGFPDVSPSHWAFKHISKLALLGIVQGDHLGLYNPENPVSQQDVIIMAIRMMGLESEALASTSTPVLPFDDVRNDARPYVAMAISKGLINLQEEIEDAKNWGNRNATRDWVAKMIVRAIGKEYDAINRAETPTPFADNDAISPSVRGYINAAVDLKLVNGFEDGTFRPSGEVTRAQMATFLSRAEQYLERRSSRVITGYVTDISGANLTIEDENGRSSRVRLQSNALFFTYKDDTRRLIPSDIQLYNEVYVIADQNGNGYFVEVTNDETPMESIEGTVVDVDIDKLTVTLQTDGIPVTYELASNVSVFASNGGGLSLGTIVPEAVVELQRNALVKDAKVSRIIVKRVPINKTVDGTLQSVDLIGMTIKFKAQDTGSEETYPITGETAFLQGGKPFDPANLYEGDLIRVEVKNSKAAAVHVLKQLVEKRDEGKLVRIDSETYPNRTLILYENSSGINVAFVSDRVQVVIDGNPYATVSDLAQGDMVKLEINDEKVDKIVVESRTVQNFKLVTINKYDQEKKWLIVIDEFGKPEIYNVSEKTRLMLDKTEVPFNSFASFLTEGKKVNLVVLDKDVVTIQIASYVEGTIAYIDSNSGEIRIRTSNNQTQKYRIMGLGTYVSIYGKPSATISDLKPGDVIRAGLAPSQDTIGNVEVKQQLLFRTTAKDITYNTITVKTADGATSSFSLSSIPIMKNGQRQLVADIRLYEPIQLQFIGTTLQAVELVEATRGIVNQVDVAGGKLTLTDYSNQTRVIETGSSFAVKVGSTVYTDLSVVKPEDRVEVVKDTSGKTWVTVIPGERREVTGYDASAKQLKLARKSLSEPLGYPLHDKAYIHQGTSVISPQSLNVKDTVTVYMIDGVIVEVSK